MSEPAAIALPTVEAAREGQVRHVACSDVDQHASAMHGWHLTVDQFSPGKFQSELSEIRVDTLQLFHERMNRAVLKRGAAWVGSLTFSIPLHINGTAHLAGNALEHSALLVTDGECLPELRTPSSHEIVVAALPATLLSGLAELVSEGKPQPREPRLIGLDAPRRARLQQALADTFRALRADPTLIDHPQVRKTLHDSIVLELLSLAYTERDVMRLDGTARRRIVERVRDHVLAHPDSPPTVLDLCTTVGASRRKLQYCFEQMLDTHPAHYVRALRLNAVRRELRCALPGSTCIGAVAARWGFWHLSRFASHYRELFGELPSDTLKRPPR
ncbi:helix-turn-helix domain-containing protein [Burkholderia pyrrocinia]|uniref:helix-turn-helix domain-containing protein n=1 Tax=Burkholderia pyrrocinia TaxID=60550 RepID=UPI00069D2F86|nr:helix-turn-helix domain-containing protein [Burkholderia pyrrocinia]